MSMYTLDGCEFAYHLPIFVSELTHSRRNWGLSLRDSIGDVVVVGVVVGVVVVGGGVVVVEAVATKVYP